MRQIFHVVRLNGVLVQRIGLTPADAQVLRCLKEG